MIPKFKNKNDLLSYFSLARFNAQMKSIVGWRLARGYGSPGPELHQTFIEQFAALDPTDAEAFEALSELRHAIRGNSVRVFEYDDNKMRELSEAVQADEDAAWAEFELQENRRLEAERAKHKAMEDAQAARERDYAERLSRPSPVMLLEGVSETEKASISALYFTAKQYRGLQEIAHLMKGLGFEPSKALELAMAHFPGCVQFGGWPLSFSFAGVDDADMRYEYMAIGGSNV